MGGDVIWARLLALAEVDERLVLLVARLENVLAKILTASLSLSPSSSPPPLLLMSAWNFPVSDAPSP